METTTINVPAFIDDRRISAFQYMVIGLCTLIMIVDGFDTQAISYAATLMAKEWGLTRAALGPIFSSSLIGLMVGYLAIPPLSDRYGHRRVIILSSIFFAIFTLLTATASGVTELIVLRFLTGLGLGGVAPSAIAMTGEYSPKRLRATFVLIIYCGFSLGFVLAGFMAAKLLPTLGWPSLFYLGGILPVVFAILMALFMPESLDHLVLRRGDMERVGAILRRIDAGFRSTAATVFSMGEREPGRLAVSQLFQQNRSLPTLLLWLVFFINLGEFYALQSWLPSVLRGMDYPMDKVALTTSLTTVGGILIAFVVGPCMDRLGPYLTVGILYICGAAAVILTGTLLHSAFWAVMVCTFLTGVCISGGQKSVIALAAIYYPASIRSTGVGWALGIGRLGGIAGPLAVGALFTAGWSATSVFFAAGLPLVVAGIAIFTIGLMNKRSAPALRPASSPAA